LVTKSVHRPSYNVYPAPCAGGVQALNIEVRVERIEEKESSLSIVHRAADSVQENENDNAEWGHNCISKRLTGSHHLFEI
jgi:hypothetical protein